MDKEFESFWVEHSDPITFPESGIECLRFAELFWQSARAAERRRCAEIARVNDQPLIAEAIEQED